MSDIQVDPHLYDGRPADGDARLDKERDCYELLERLGIAFARVDHARADTIEACAAVEAVLGGPICKNLFLCDRQQTRFYLLLMPGHKPFKTKYLAGQFDGPRLSFAPPERLETLLHLTPGSVSVFGLQYDTARQVRLLIDRDVPAEEFVCFHPCINTSTVRFRSSDLMDGLLPHWGVTPTMVTLPWQPDDRGRADEMAAADHRAAAGEPLRGVARLPGGGDTPAARLASGSMFSGENAD